MLESDGLTTIEKRVAGAPSSAAQCAPPSSLFHNPPRLGLAYKVDGWLGSIDRYQRSSLSPVDFQEPPPSSLFRIPATVAAYTVDVDGSIAKALAPPNN